MAAQPAVPGEPCTVLEHRHSGIDSCAPGAMCWNVAEDGLEGTCVELCTGTADQPRCSDARALCSISNQGVLNLCLHGCDPLVQDCPPGQGCYANGEGFACEANVSAPDQGEYGDACDALNACNPGLLCIGQAVFECPAYACCTPICTVNDRDPRECPEASQGEACLALFGADAPAHLRPLGVCAIPQ